MTRRGGGAGIVLLLAIASLPLPAPRHGATATARVRPADVAAPMPRYPDGFSGTLVAPVPAPTALAFTPDGRMLVTTQLGRLLVHTGAELLAEPALDLGPLLCTRLEQGLLGIAVDPAFAVNGFVYLYWTIDRFGCVNRVSRFTMAGDRVDPASELVLLDNIPSPNGNHIAGDLHFGKDGYLYVSVGDGGCDYAGGGCAGGNDASRDRHVLQGKILRITSTGDVPPDNPFNGPGSSRCNKTGLTEPGRWCAETFAWGLRNPFRMAFDPDAPNTRFYVNDVGQDHWEEIDEGRAGADYGWSVREGHCANGSATNCGPPPGGMTNPIHDYHHDTGCTAITGGAFVPRGVWPQPYDGAYLFSDYTCGTIFRLVRAADGSFTRDVFVSGLGALSAVHMGFPPGGGRRGLYFTTYADGGQIRRIDYTGGANRAPVATLTADLTSGPVPLAVRFDAAGSWDPEGEALLHVWDFGDGSLPAETVASTVTHTYAESGPTTATLTVRDPRGAVSSPARLRIVPGDDAPAVRITSPAPGHRFRVGERITVRGLADDAQDGALEGKALRWMVVLHHSSHTHPFLVPVAGRELRFDAPGPENLQAAGNSSLEIRLTATDSAGLSTTVARMLRPRAVEVTFLTVPDGLTINVQGMPFQGPRTFTSWAGYRLDLEARGQERSGTRWTFSSWSDGGGASHTVDTPDTATTYTATFVPMGATHDPSS